MDCRKCGGLTRQVVFYDAGGRYPASHCLICGLYVFPGKRSQDETNTPTRRTEDTVYDLPPSLYRME
jgi:hypothetical protein